MTHISVVSMMNTLLLKVPKLSLFDVHAMEDDSKSGFWYIVLYHKNGTQFMHKYVDASMRISANFMMDPNFAGPDMEAMLTVNDATGDITMHNVGAGKLHLPGIANSSGARYTEQDLQLSVTQYVQNLLPVGTAVMTTSASKKWDGDPGFRLVPKSKCDCGAHKCGYSNTELYGHAHWCELVRRSRGEDVGHGNGD